MNKPSFMEVLTAELIQPILSNEPEHGHKPEHVLTLSQFLTLLRPEEDYFQGEEENIGVMITRLRKIFYDKWGWDKMLIRNTAAIKGRYEVRIIDCDSNTAPSDVLKKVKYYTNDTYTPKCRLVTYREDDRVYGNTRAGTVPEIYEFDHADVRLPEGNHGDIAHVLAGLDALNNLQLVSPLPDSLLYLYRLFPYATSNADVATWLGDIATSAMDFVFAYIKNGNKPLDAETEQRFININASASDMLGNIDAFAIYNLHKSGAFKSKRVSGMLEEYYGDDNAGTYLRGQRYKLFTEHIGLEWDGQAFTNEEQWLTIYEGELRSTISFMIYSVTDEPINRYYLPYRVWKKEYEGVIKVNLLLRIFLDALIKLM